MNYKFLSTFALVVCMYMEGKADTSKATLPLKQEGLVVAPSLASSTLKIGYIDSHYVYENWPEAKKNMADLGSFKKQLENQLQEKIKELEEKGSEYQQQVDAFTEAQKKQRYAELQKLQMGIQEFQEELHMKVQTKANELMQPLQKRMEALIQKVAEEQSYTFILNKNIEYMPIVLFALKTLDISDIVLEKIKSMAPEAIKPPVVGVQSRTTAAKKVSPKPAAKPATKPATQSDVKNKCAC